MCVGLLSGTASFPKEPDSWKALWTPPGKIRKVFRGVTLPIIHPRG